MIGGTVGMYMGVLIGVFSGIYDEKWSTRFLAHPPDASTAWTYKLTATHLNEV